MCVSTPCEYINHASYPHLAAETDTVDGGGVHAVQVANQVARGSFPHGALGVLAGRAHEARAVGEASAVHAFCVPVNHAAGVRLCHLGM